MRREGRVVVEQVKLISNAGRFTITGSSQKTAQAVTISVDVWNDMRSRWEKMQASDDLVVTLSQMVKSGSSSEDIGNYFKKQIASWVVGKL